MSKKSKRDHNKTAGGEHTATNAAEHDERATKENLTGLAAHLANVWSLAYYQAWRLRRLELDGAIKNPEGELSEAMRVLQESSGALYHYRDLLKAFFEEQGHAHVYESLAKTAAFQFYEEAQKVYEETGSMIEAAKYLNEQLTKFKSESGQA